MAITVRSTSDRLVPLSYRLTDPLDDHRSATMPLEVGEVGDGSLEFCREGERRLG
jgi:hypothetical protein